MLHTRFDLQISRHIYHGESVCHLLTLLCLLTQFVQHFPTDHRTLHRSRTTRLVQTCLSSILVRISLQLDLHVADQVLSVLVPPVRILIFQTFGAGTHPNIYKPMVRPLFLSTAQTSLILWLHLLHRQALKNTPDLLRPHSLTRYHLSYLLLTLTTTSANSTTHLHCFLVPSRFLIHTYAHLLGHPLRYRPHLPHLLLHPHRRIPVLTSLYLLLTT